MEFVHVQKQAIGNALAQQVHAKQEAGSNSAKRDMRDELAKLKDMAQQLEVCTLVCIADGFVHSLSNRWPRVRCAAPAPHACSRFSLPSFRVSVIFLTSYCLCCVLAARARHGAQQSEQDAHGPHGELAAPFGAQNH